MLDTTCIVYSLDEDADTARAFVNSLYDPQCEVYDNTIMLYLELRGSMTCRWFDGRVEDTSGI